MTILKTASLLLCAFVLAPAARAVPIIYTLVVTGSGTLDGTAFTNQTFTITGDADTSINVDTYGIDNTKASSTSVNVAGIGTDAITDSVYFFMHSCDGGAWIGPYGVYIGSTDLCGDNLFAPFPAASGNATDGISIPQWNQTWNTAGGTFFLSNAGTATFSAAYPTVPTVTPEPPALFLMASGLLLLIVRWQKAAHG